VREFLAHRLLHGNGNSGQIEHPHSPSEIAQGETDMKSAILTLAALAAIAFAATPAKAEHARQRQPVFVQQYYVPQYASPYSSRTIIYQGGYAPGCGVGGHYHPGHIDSRAGYYRGYNQGYNPGYIGVQTRGFSFRLGY
jgi:hypothetical protein